MKNRIINIVAIWLLGITSAFAKNTIYADDVNVTAGQTVVLDIKMKNDLTVAGLGFTLTLPEGLSLVVDEDDELVYSLNNNRAKSTKFSVFSAVKEKGVYGVRIMPTSTSVIQETDGLILSLQLQVDANMTAGSYKVPLTGNSFTVKEDDNSLRTEKLSNSSFSVNVTAEIQDVTADNYLYADDVNVTVGQTVTLDIKMKNELTVAGLGFTLTLPNGLSLEVDEENELVYSLNSDRDKNTKFSVVSVSNGNGVYGVRIMPTSTSEIKGKDGPILSLQLQVAETMAAGTYQIQLTENSITVKEENNALRTERLDDKIINVIVKAKDEPVLLGDVNNDGTVDISDYIGVANHILGNTPEGFNEKAADINEDGAIDISDYIGVANIILTGKP